MKNTKHLFICFIGIILIASILRAPITSISPLLTNIINTINISPGAAALLVSLPLLIFATLSVFIFSFTKKISLETSLMISIILITLGMLIRSHINVYSIFLGTIIIGIGITISNVLIPVFIKQKFPNNIHIIISVYGLMMGLGSWLTISLMIPIMHLAQKLSYSGNSSLTLALSSVAILGIITLITWLPQLKNKTLLPKNDNSTNLHSHIWKSKIAWQISIFLSCSSILMYTLSTWIPSILESKGYSIQDAGYLAGLFQISCLPVLIITPLMKILKNKNIITLVFALCNFLGILFLLLNIFTFIAIVMLGIGVGGAFMVSLILIGIRTSNTQLAAVLSGKSQSIAYILAALGPIIAGTFHQITSSWKLPLIICLCVTVIMVIFSLFVANPEKISVDDI
ncbi:MFS transporter [Francisella philomiragia]|uniref:MFS transporter n=1 Tax=Francisella philomiragia TaxID=28110 RepID=UPI001905994E|nr:MFS transporter [Francisella philomiragia]MBK2092405.1 MFS transporter [Francisella philomiragia]MBK2257289.1 MFS transporter [Francisella philomiragia]MBK2269946.1 MFS transporter [Francisella philomiragia]MBK2271708.1 MFS transporter [Francisella philomiragia]MBK2275665.1 MFS transporter [Francisella philomiragia]